MGRLQERLDHSGGWDLESRLKQARDAAHRVMPRSAHSPVANGAG
jgi:hypothetical protein